MVDSLFNPMQAEIVNARVDSNTIRYYTDAMSSHPPQFWYEQWLRWNIMVYHILYRYGVQQSDKLITADSFGLALDISGIIYWLQER